MRLAQFILTHSEAILIDFEDFARTHTDPGDDMSVDGLRDHAASMLTTIAEDLNEPQSKEEEVRKSQGDDDGSTGHVETPAEKHGADRASHGFSIEEMFSEYRALRASVLRLWTATRPERDEVDARDLIRFNEAIDQALAESITRFATGIGDSREMFLAILGHDLRNPLGAVISGSAFLATESDLQGRNLVMVQAMNRSARRMERLVSDLLDFTRTRLGAGIPITRATVDIAEVVRETVEEFKGRDTDSRLRFEHQGDVCGEWDGGRIGQAVSNLIGNAFQHGDEEHPIRVSVTGATLEVVVAVRNWGPPIHPKHQLHIFDPYRRATSTQSNTEVQGSMGLGLYITQQIAHAHAGWITLESSAKEGTVFELHLPRDGMSGPTAAA